MLDLKPQQLQFPKPLETEFREEYERKSLPYARWASAVTLGLVLLAGINDANLTPAARALVGSVRYGVICPVLLGLFLFSFSRWFQPLIHAYTAASVLLFGGTILFLSIRMADQPQRNAYDYLMAMSMAAYTVVHLRFLTAAFVSWSVFIAYILVAGLILHLPPPTLLKQTVFLFIVNVLGMFSSYSTERYVRREFLLTRRIEAEAQKSERLLLNILPQPIADRLKADNKTIADTFAEVTVLFADIVDFTPVAARMSPVALVDLLNAVFSRFDELAETYGLEKIKTIGDAYMVVGGLPEPRPDHAEAVVEMALAMQEEIRGFLRPDGRPFQLRIGINTGTVVAGVIGTKKFIYDLWGDTVNVASRMETHGIEGAIQVTPATYSHLELQYRFEAREPIHVKGRGEMRPYLLLGRAEEPATPSTATPP